MFWLRNKIFFSSKVKRNGDIKSCFFKEVTQSENVFCCFLIELMLYTPVTNFSVMSGGFPDFLG